MSNNDNQVTQRRSDPLQRLMDQLAPKMETVLPKHLTPERMVRVVMVEGARNPKLRECTPGSLATCVMLAGQLGLEPSSPMGHFYLIPRYNRKINGMECTALIGYKGLLELARRSGQIARINAGVVYREEVERGLFEASIEPPDITHRFPLDKINRNDSEIVAAYCVIELRDGSKAQVILTRDEIEKRKGRSQSAGKGYSPWSTDYPAMARKSAIRALLNGGTVPLSSELQTAIQHDAERYEPIDTDARTVERRDTTEQLANILDVDGDEPRALPDYGEADDLTAPERERVEVGDSIDDQLAAAEGR